MAIPASKALIAQVKTLCGATDADQACLGLLEKTDEGGTQVLLFGRTFAKAILGDGPFAIHNGYDPNNYKE